VLAKQALWHLSYTSSPLCSGYFGIGSCELAAPAGLESQSSQSQSPNWQGLPAWATGTQLQLWLWRTPYSLCVIAHEWNASASNVRVNWPHYNCWAYCPSVEQQ
jgi:hypothetical protein